jgi:hypothetical protein
MTTGHTGGTAIVLRDGRVLVAGGMDGCCGEQSDGQPLASAELYNPRTGRWTRTGSMTMARAGHTATLLPNGRVLVTGGLDSSGTARSSTDLYDPGPGRWRAATPMLVAHADHTATLLRNGPVLVAGGDSRGTSGVYTP